MTLTKAVSVAALLAASTAASAAVTSVGWKFVAGPIGPNNGPGVAHPGDPGADTFAGAMWNALNQYTFDLFLFGDSGQRINGINMGDSAAPGATPYFIATNGEVFNHSFGSNTQSATEFPPFNALAFDTYVDLGGTQATPSISFAGGADLNDPMMRATWFTTDETVLDANGEMRIMRVTVGYADDFNPWTDGGYLGTPGIPGLVVGDLTSSIEIGLPAGELQTLTVGNAFEIPAPGAAAVLGLAGLAGIRRRR